MIPILPDSWTNRAPAGLLRSPPVITGMKQKPERAKIIRGISKNSLCFQPRDRAALLHAIDADVKKKALSYSRGL
jgi:hypothetical protein